MTVTPGGGTFFLKGKDTDEPALGLRLGGGITVNLNRYIGVEGEVAGSLGISQSLKFPSSQRELKSLNMLQ